MSEIPFVDDVTPYTTRTTRLLLAFRKTMESPVLLNTDRAPPPGFNVDMASSIIGHGGDAFARAKRALTEWRHFELGWVELFPHGASTEPGTVVAVLAHHLGLWSLNGCRVVYGLGEEDVWQFGFAYGTLSNHIEMGEESFEVAMARDTDETR